MMPYCNIYVLCFCTYHTKVLKEITFWYLIWSKMFWYVMYMCTLFHCSLARGLKRISSQPFVKSLTDRPQWQKKHNSFWPVTWEAKVQNPIKFVLVWNSTWKKYFQQIKTFIDFFLDLLCDCSHSHEVKWTRSRNKCKKYKKKSGITWNTWPISGVICNPYAI